MAGRPVDTEDLSMSRRTALPTLVALVALTTACTTEWPPEVDAALEVAETGDVAGVRLPQRSADGVDRAAALRAAPTTVEVAEPGGDPLPRRAEWVDLGATPSNFTGGLVVVVDRIELTPDHLTVEARLLSQRDRDAELLYDPDRTLRLITANGFTISPSSETTSWEPPGVRERTYWPLPSGGSETIVATFDRPLVDPPIGLAVHRFEDLPLQLD